MQKQPTTQYPEAPPKWPARVAVPTKEKTYKLPKAEKRSAHSQRKHWSRAAQEATAWLEARREVRDMDERCEPEQHEAELTRQWQYQRIRQAKRDYAWMTGGLNTVPPHQRMAETWN